MEIALEDTNMNSCKNLKECDEEKNFEQNGKNLKINDVEQLDILKECN